jgi:hypothetical protein
MCAVGAVTAWGREAAAGCDSENEKTIAAVAAIAAMARVCLPLIVDLLNLPRECRHYCQPDLAICRHHRSKEEPICDQPLPGTPPQ